jgi:pimeloyl-ACP methyl ester carboxylesterase
MEEGSENFTVWFLSGKYEEFASASDKIIEETVIKFLQPENTLNIPQYTYNSKGGQIDEFNKVYKFNNFREIDLNNDGYLGEDDDIKKEVLMLLIEKNLRPELKGLCDSLGAYISTCHTISYIEYIMLLHNLLPDNSTISMLDVDTDGFLSPKEMILSLGIRHEKVWDFALEQMDTNGDRKLSVTEYMVFISNKVTNTTATDNDLYQDNYEDYYEGSGDFNDFWHNYLLEHNFTLSEESYPNHVCTDHLNVTRVCSLKDCKNGCGFKRFLTETSDSFIYSYTKIEEADTPKLGNDRSTRIVIEMKSYLPKHFGQQIVDVDSFESTEIFIDDTLNPDKDDTYELYEVFHYPTKENEEFLAKCIGNNKETKNKEKPVQWFHYYNKNTETFLDLSSINKIVFSEPKKGDTQLWRLDDDGIMKNKGANGLAVGINKDRVLQMYPEDSLEVLTDMSFKNGRLSDKTHSFRYFVSKNESAVSKRDTSSSDDETLTELKAGIVDCPELLNWPPFQPMQNNPVNTQCWGEIRPSFRLYMDFQNSSIATTERHLSDIVHLTFKKITKLVVVVHGFTANADVGNWPDEIADLVMKHDKTDTLAVLTIDWNEGADLRDGYALAVANTRYVGIAAERVIRQLNQNDDIFIHCIGHSLGAHICGFLGNAIKEDSCYSKSSLDRITALDPAGPHFYSSSYANPTPITGPLGEKLDRTDADLVDVIHTDSNTLGIVQPIGHTDFYIGENSRELGANQAGCSVSPVCDHGRSHELLRYSISHKTHCWGHFRCHNSTLTRGCTVPESCNFTPIPYPVPRHPRSGELTISAAKIRAAQKLPKTYPAECNPDLSPRVQFGYWYDGSQPGSYGVILTGDKCYGCVEDAQCLGEEKCDVLKHQCVSQECVRDEHCDPSQTCDLLNHLCTPEEAASCKAGRRKRQADRADEGGWVRTHPNYDRKGALYIQADQPDQPSLYTKISLNTAHLETENFFEIERNTCGEMTILESAQSLLYGKSGSPGSSTKTMTQDKYEPWTILTNDGPEITEYDYYSTSYHEGVHHHDECEAELFVSSANTFPFFNKSRAFQNTLTPFASHQATINVKQFATGVRVSVTGSFAKEFGFELKINGKTMDSASFTPEDTENLFHDRWMKSMHSDEPYKTFAEDSESFRNKFKATEWIFGGNKYKCGIETHVYYSFYGN